MTAGGVDGKYLISVVCPILSSIAPAHFFQFISVEPYYFIAFKFENIFSLPESNRSIYPNLNPLTFIVFISKFHF